MKLSLADKIALIYTSAGSIRKTAALAGISHQTAGRILHNAMMGRSNASYEARPELRAGVQVAFDIHKDLARGQAQRDKIPFNGELPVFAERLALRNQAVIADGKMLFRGPPELCRAYLAGRSVEFETTDSRTGEIKRRVYQIDPALKSRAERVQLLGERVGALHMHWLSDRIRNAWLISNQRSGKYYAATAGSKVNLREYNRRSNILMNERAKQGMPRTKKQIIEREQIKQRIKESDAITTQRVYTALTSMDPRHIPELVIADMTDKLQTRHAPATGQPGTSLGDEIIMQLDTRKNQQHGTDHAKARGNKAGNRSRAAKTQTRR